MSFEFEAILSTMYGTEHPVVMKLFILEVSSAEEIHAEMASMLKEYVPSFLTVP